MNGLLLKAKIIIRNFENFKDISYLDQAKGRFSEQARGRNMHRHSGARRQHLGPCATFVSLMQV